MTQSSGVTDRAEGFDYLKFINKKRRIILPYFFTFYNI